MGLLIGRLCCSKRWLSGSVRGLGPVQATAAATSTTTRTASALRRYKVLLLGPAGSGKTELGLYLSGQRRAVNDQSPTNGVRFYRVALPCRAIELALTEVGGNVEMQRLWSHYFITSLAVVYCYDISTSNAELCVALALLQRTLDHAALRGKAVLLVATHAQATNCQSVQLYDIENTFGLEALASRYGSGVRLCYFDGRQLEVGDVWSGVEWLHQHLQQQQHALALRVKYDQNMQSWQRRKNVWLGNGGLAHVQRQRFRRHRKLWPSNVSSSRFAHERPRTAPSSVFSITTLTTLSSATIGSGA